MKKLPDSFKKFFWDINTDELDVEKYPKFVIERLLEHGDFDAIDWLKQNYQESKIQEVVRTSRRISPKTGNFFALYYNLPKHDLVCMQKHFI
jgi:hypothetical protein